MNTQAMIEEVVVAARRAYVPFDGLQVVERPGWFQLVAPAFKTGGFNDVTLAVLSEAEADSVIDETIAGYRALGLRFRWSVGPDSRPHDLAKRLEARGLQRTEVLGMARSTAFRRVGGTVSPAIEVADVDASNVGRFGDVMAQGWSIDRAPLDALHALAIADPLRRQELVLASVDGVPAGVASTFLFERSAYLLGAVVLPEFRGRGVYRAMVEARLRRAVKRGLELATSRAQAATSAPLLEKMGFEAVCTFASFSG